MKHIFSVVVLFCVVLFGSGIGEAGKKCDDPRNPGSCVNYVKSKLPPGSKWHKGIGEAKNWWSLAKRDEQSPTPQPNSIMVFNSWGNNTAGHVAYVTSVNGNEVTVDHSNFDCDYQADHEVFVLENNNKYAFRKSAGFKSKRYPVLGFVLLSAQSQPQPPMPSPSPVPQPQPQPKQSYYIRITNIDDVGECFVNGTKVVSVGYYGDTGWVDITNKLHRGDNKIEFRVKNNKGGYTYHFAFKENNNLKWEKRCGEVGREGCKERLR
ncbi:MAG: CHAP domain-containing protein [Nitrospirota bacterium]